MGEIDERSVSGEGSLAASTLVVSSAIDAGADNTRHKDVLELASRVADWQLERMGATHGVTKFAEETATHGAGSKAHSGWV